MNPWNVLPGFAIGKFLGDAWVLFTAKVTADEAVDLLHGKVSWQSGLTAAAGLLLISGVLFIDWRELFGHKKLRLNLPSGSNDPGRAPRILISRAIRLLSCGRRSMRAVWSFWSKPFHTHHKRVWRSDLHHLLAWVLSVERARLHYPRTVLVTDSDGARLLVDRLGLRFTTVMTTLTALDAVDPEWWVMGKLWAYRAQKEPFVHLDNDVFLWKRLPETLERVPVFAQNPEWFPHEGESWYRPARYARAIQAVGGWAPEEWRWSTSRNFAEAVCCGVLGGAAVDFLAYYADLAIQMIEHPRNGAAWLALGSRIGDNILFEQYLLAACLEFHGGRPGSPFSDVHAAYLFPSSDDAFDEPSAVRAGYTHLIGGAKNDAGLMARLAARVRRDYPEQYARCLNCVDEIEGIPPA